MQSAPLPPNEKSRLQALQELGILDTEPEFLYDDVTELASNICDTPICLVSLIDGERQWFKSRHGLAATETPRELAFCAHAILGNELFEIEDSRKDIRFHDNPLVTDAPNVVFYAGIPLELAEGVNVGTLCVIDNKPRVLTEKQRSALRCLGHQVVAHLRLRRTNQELERALKAKATFLASMSHEIRTPMNGIIGITNILINSTKDRESLDYLRIIRNCSDILLTILNDILDFSKIESGKIGFETHPFSLETAIQVVQEVLDPLAKNKSLRIVTDTGDSPDWFVGDATRLSQILMNLLGNAIKFSVSGEIILAVKKETVSGHKTKLTFSVQDQGIGISNEEQAKLFKSFSQVDSSTSRKYGGTGLGLAISKGLVEGMGGQIWVKSERGKGSTFFFTLELDLAQKGVEESPLKPIPVDSANLASVPKNRLAEFKPMSILIAEDNRVNQIVAMKIVASFGYTSDLAANGLEVLQMMKSKRYDIILMDCQMPEMDGFEATEYIFNNYPPENRPAIYALTAGVMEEERTRCLSMGMRAILHKPIDVAALRNVFIECPLNTKPPE